MQKDILQQLKSKDPEQRKQAISRVAKSKNEKALPLLAKIMEKDPDEGVRQLADKARQFIKKQTMTATAAVPPPPSLTEKKKGSKAQPYIEETMRLLELNDTRKAAKMLTNALLIDPALQNDKAVGALASEIMDKPPRLAIEALLKKSGNLPQRKGGSTVSPVYTVLRFIALLAGVFTVIALVIWGNETGQFDEFRLAMQMDNWENNHQYSEGRFKYYVLVPDGQPPAEGFPVLVVLHGYGGTGIDLLPRYAPHVNDDRFILVSPEFGEYEFPYDVFVIPNLQNILTAVEANFPAQVDHVTLYGFSAGAEIASMYTQTYPSRVSAQVLEGSPEIHTPTSGYAPTVVLYGDQDNLREMTGSSVNVLRDRGYLHSNRILENIGHEATASGLNWSLQMLRDF